MSVEPGVVVVRLAIDFGLHTSFAVRGLITTGATPHEIVRPPITVHCVSGSRSISVPKFSAIAGEMYAIMDKRYAAT